MLYASFTAIVFSPKLVLLQNTDMKILNSQAISAFGGYNFVIDKLDQLGIDKTLQEELPSLPKQSKYTWKDILYSFWGIYFCGGDCIEDLTLHLKQSFTGNPKFKIPSADRVLERLKQLALPCKYKTTPRGTALHQFSIHKELNRLNIKLLKRHLKQTTQDVVLDYDNTLLYTKKSDAAKTYKKQFGYAPGVGLIGSNVVYVENRNGNSAPPNLQEDTLERMFSLLLEQGIKIDKFRADGGSYNFSILRVVNKYVGKFYIRANMNSSLEEAISQVEKWEKIELEERDIYRGSTAYSPFRKIAKRRKQKELVKQYRLVVSKEPRDDGQLNVFTGEAYNYKAVLTNDFEASDDEVVFFYNQRGAIEREFDVIKNDFGWNNMPFSKLEQNTVFLILSAICRNIYQYIIIDFSKHHKLLKPHYRIKKFIFRFICRPAKWVYNGRQYKLRVYSDIAFKT